MNIVSFVPLLSDPESVVSKFCAKSIKIPVSVELVYLPFVLFKYKVEMTRFFAGKKTEQGLILADMLQGVPMNIKREVSFEVKAGLQEYFKSFFPLSRLRDEKRAEAIAVEAVEVPDEQVLPMILDEALAVDRGRRLLRYELMRLAGNLRYRRFEISPFPETKVVYYPYWLVYYRNRQGQMQFNVIDGVSGQKESGDVVTSLKMGLVRKHPGSLSDVFLRGENKN